MWLYLDTNLLVDACLTVLDLLLELLEGGGIGSGAVCLQDLDILVGQGSDLLLFGLIIGKLLLILLPVLTRGAGHGGGGLCVTRV